ncbi:RNA-dependent RNA polymerase [Klebsormidium nitens]|uniref:RNA-dependent RNA polymerase n=1 Tax=Klebsormidium nitens TaxID=105231 RepID=A0A1Y1HWF8_KLENI|nr:RNA-dependent RNA polymerase [Klebsormidium nitens]|eukprot:GAQ82122.1 RNA-dependent RNA polymerase [Klebsormidium nitens]
MAANSVFVGGVPPMCASSELALSIVQAIRTTTGLKPKECTAPEPKLPGRARFAFVTFRSEEEARECIRYDQHIYLGGVSLTVRARRNGTRRTETEEDKVRLDRGVRLEMGHLTGPREVCVTWKANGTDGTDGLKGAPKEVALEADFSARRLSLVVRCADHDRGSSTGEEPEPTSPLEEVLGRLLHSGKRSRLEADLDPLVGYVCSGTGSSPQASTWREEDEWSRTVDFTGNDSIGRSFCYVLFFPNDETNRKIARELCRGFGRFHLLRHAVSLDQLIMREWEHCRRGAVQTPEVSSFPTVHGIRGVLFHLMFQVQQLVQHGVVAESALARDARFYAQLLPASCFEEQIAERALKEMVGSSAYIFRPAERLSEIRRKLRRGAQRPVALLDKPAPVARFRQAVRGFPVGSRRYEFLAFSTSQVREQAVWFYAPEEEETADGVRKRLGQFEGINNVGESAKERF